MAAAQLALAVGPHADSMLAYAADAASTLRPWLRWQARRAGSNGAWKSHTSHPSWLPHFEYRRDPAYAEIPAPPPSPADLVDDDREASGDGVLMIAMVGMAICGGLVGAILATLYFALR